MPQPVAVWFATFVPVYMYFHWFYVARALVLVVLDLIPHLRTYSPCHLDLEIYPILGIVFMC